MSIESTKKVKRHIGRNVRRVRMYFGVKQEALAADLGISQPEVSKIENQDEIEEVLLSQIADALGISSEVIRDFDIEKTILNINQHNCRDTTISEGVPTDAVSHQVNPFEKIVELYKRLLKSEQEKIELLKNR